MERVRRKIKVDAGVKEIKASFGGARNWGKKKKNVDINSALMEEPRKLKFLRTVLCYQFPWWVK